MGEQKHIDRIFQERFKDFEATPGPAVWGRIEAQLNATQKKRRKIIPIWWRYAGAAALIAVLIGISLNKTPIIENNQTTPQITNTNTPPKQLETKITLPSATKPLNSKTNAAAKEVEIQPSSQNVIAGNNVVKQQTVKPTLRYKSQKNKNFSAASKNTTIKGYTTSTKNNTITQNNNSNNVAGTKSVTSTNTPKENHLDKTQIVARSPKPPIEDQLNTNDKPSIQSAIDANKAIAENNTTQKTKENKWSVAPTIAPVYFNSLSKGSSLNEQFTDNSTNGEVNISYGINARYAINKRITIRAGVNRVNLGFNTNNVIAFSASSVRANVLASENINQNNAIATVTNDIELVSAENTQTNLNALPTDNAVSLTSINQSFGFIEVPLEFQYAVSTKRLGVNLIGGFSSFFLNTSSYSSEINGRVTELQSNNNINETSYSANVGLGLNYKVSKKINVNVEPLFKYQINTFKNTTGNFQPFFVGVYTGLAVKF